MTTTATTPAISVIVPVYNTERYLRRCIDSILAQTFTDFELLLIDDGSTDTSPAICDEYAQRDPRVRVFHKPNGGVSSARNLGLDNALGEWISFVDADDWVDEEYLKTLLKGSKSDLAVCSFIIEGSKEEWPVTIPNGIQENDGIHNILINHTLDASFSASWCKLYKSSIINSLNLKFNNYITSGEDTLFFFTYLQKCDSIYCINEQLYHYNRNVQGLSTATHSNTNSFTPYISNLGPILSILSKKFHISNDVLKLYIFEPRVRRYLSQSCTTLSSTVKSLTTLRQHTTLSPIFSNKTCYTRINNGKKRYIFNFLYNNVGNWGTAFYIILLKKLGRESR